MQSIDELRKKKRKKNGKRTGIGSVYNNIDGQLGYYAIHPSSCIEEQVIASRIHLKQV